MIANESEEMIVLLISEWNIESDSNITTQVTDESSGIISVQWKKPPLAKCEKRKKFGEYQCFHLKPAHFTGYCCKIPGYELSKHGF